MTNIVCVLKTNEGGLWVVPQLEECRRRGHSVSAILPPGNGRLRRVLEEHGFKVVDSAFDFSFRPSTAMVIGLVRLRRQIKALHARVVFYHLIASALSVRLATLFMRIRRVHMVAGPLYLDSWPIRLAERLLCRLDHQLIGGSAHTAARYRELRMPAERVSAIPYGVDTDRFSRGEDCRQDLLGVPAGSFVAIMVAYVYAPKSSVYPGVGIKGHETLLAAWQHFARGRNNVHLVIVGSGFDDAGELHRQWLIRTFNLEADRTVHWFRSVDDVREFYSSADVSVSPSLSENHGAALEASAMSCPSIVSNAGALPEAVVPERTGWVVRAADIPALRAALEAACDAWNDARLAQMGAAARSHVLAHFSLTDCAARVADVILR